MPNFRLDLIIFGVLIGLLNLDLETRLIVLLE